MVKQRSSKKPEAVKPFHLFLSNSGGVGKSHLIKTVYQSVSKYQYHGGSTQKLQVLILAPIGVASTNINEATIHSTFGLPCCGKCYPLDSNTVASLQNKILRSSAYISG